MASLADSGPTQQQMLLAALLGGAPPQRLASAEEDDADENAAPVTPAAPYMPISGGDEPAFVPPNLLAQALAGGGMSMPPGGRPAATSPESAPPVAPSGTRHAQLPGPPLTLSDDQGANPLAGLARAIGIGGPPPAANLPAPAAAPAPGAPAAQNIAGQASDIGGAEDATIAAYRAEHDHAVSQYDANMAAARQAAAAGRDPAAYLKMAADAGKIAEDASMKAIEYAKPLRTVTAGQYVLNQKTGKYEQPVPPENTTNPPTDEEAARLIAAGHDPKNYVIKDGMPIPIAPDRPINTEIVHLGDGTSQLINKETGEPVGKPIGTPSRGGALIGRDGNPVDENLSGPDVLNAVPAPVAIMAQRMIDGLQPVPGQGIRTSPLAQQAYIAAQAVDPRLDANESKQRMGTQKDFTSGPTSKVITAGNTALGHLTELAGLVPELHNFDLPYGATVLNTPINALKGTGAAGAALARFNELNQLYSAEMEKFYAGSSGGTAGERKQLELNISSNMSPTQQMAAIQQAAKALASKVEALQGQWHSGMGPLATDFEVIHPENQAFVESMRSGRLGPLMQGERPASQEDQAQPGQAGGWGKATRVR